jgi:DNA repair photolyase
MNLYRGCEHGCVYCDGRAERYRCQGDFQRDIVVKRNAVSVLASELSRIREPGFVFLGGGVCDAYQPAEADYGLARGVLSVALERRLPVHVLTKSSLVERDFELLQRINDRTGALLSFSIQTLDDEVRELFEPHAAPIDQRFELLARAQRAGLGVGVMAMPVLPGISDQPEAIEALVERAAALRLDFVCHGGLTLRPGAQMDCYLETLRRRFPQHLSGYQRLFRAIGPSGAGDGRYYQRVEQRFRRALSLHAMAARPPRRLFCGLIPRYTEAAVLLEHRHYELAGEGRPGHDLCNAGYAIQKWARSRFAAKRSRTYDYRAVEQEFRASVDDRSVLALPGMTDEALPVMEQVLFRHH